MRFFTKRRIVILLAVVAGLAALGAYGYYTLIKAQKDFIESKGVRTATARVTDKKFVRYDEHNRTYVSDYGDRVEMQPGQEQWRVYYQIEDFGFINEPRRSRVIEAEKKRVAEFGPRFTYSVPWYDSIKVGDKLEIGYRAFKNGDIQVWTVNKKN